MIFICIQCAFTCGATVNTVQIQTKLNSRKRTTDKSLSPKERLSNKLIWKFVSSKCQNPWSRWKSIQQIPMQQEIMVKPIASIRLNKNQISFRFWKICVYPFLSSFTNLIISTIIILYILSSKLRFSSSFTNLIIFLMLCNQIEDFCHLSQFLSVGCQEQGRTLHKWCRRVTRK